MAVKDSLRNDLLRHRLNWAFFWVILFYMLLIGRLFYLQVKMGESLRKTAVQDRRERIPIRADRGAIYDRNGVLLASSVFSGTVSFDPSAIEQDRRDVSLSSGEKKRLAKLETLYAQDIPRLAQLLNLSPAELKDKMDRARLSWDPVKKTPRFVPLQKDISADVARLLGDVSFRQIGIGVVPGSRRDYPVGMSAAQVVGFMRKVRPGEVKQEDKGLDRDAWMGAMGLERSCAEWLDERSGYVMAEVDNQHREIPDTRSEQLPAKDGLNVVTTLDAKIQEFALEEAQKIDARYHPKQGISIVVMDPKTGDILAMVSSPTFDPNFNQRPGVRGIPAVNAAAQWDRCASRLYEPGSTLKALTIAAALDQNVIGLGSRFYCSGTLQVGKGRIHCASHGGSSAHGSETPLDIMRHSCNVGASEIGLKMGARKLYTYERKFGLLDPPGSGLFRERAGKLSLDKNERIYTSVKAARVAFGHSIVTTPLHVTMAYGALTNGGMLMKPRLISAVKDSRGNVVKTFAPVKVRQVVSPAVSAEICDMLRAVISNGTGAIAALPGYMVAGKTGTANKYKAGAYIGSFVGFAPASPKTQPRAVILIAVDEPQNGYYGADVAAPAFRELSRKLLAYWRVPEDDPNGVQLAAAKVYRKHTEKSAGSLARD